jgi:putative tricarboxylic transport membrane protein
MSQSGPSPAAPAAASAQPDRDLAQLGLCAFLAALGALVLYTAATLGDNRTGVDPLGPQAVPLVLGPSLIILAIVLAVATLRGDRGEAEGGEDVDLDRGIDVRTVLLLVGVFVANILLIDFLGWVISGGLLFYGSAIALGSRHFVRDLAISAALALATFYGFAIGLGVGLPAGILQGIL